MKRTSFHCVPRAIVQYTQDDLDILIDCATSHYDGKVRSLEHPGRGAILNGMRNYLGENETAEYELSQGDIDTILKALENPKVNAADRARLYMELRGIFQELQDEYRRLNEPEDTKGGNANAEVRT